MIGINIGEHQCNIELVCARGREGRTDGRTDGEMEGRTDGREGGADESFADEFSMK